MKALLFTRHQFVNQITFILITKLIVAFTPSFQRTAVILIADLKHLQIIFRSSDDALCLIVVMYDSVGQNNCFI